jgi:hypothetical protein
MATETFVFTMPPGDDDQSDGGIYYALGMRFVVTSEAGGSCVGVDWLAPTIGPAGTQQVALYNLSGALLAISNTFTCTPGIINRVLFTRPFTLIAGTHYMATVLTNRYAYTVSVFVSSGLTSSPGSFMTAPAVTNGYFKETTAGVMVAPDTVGASKSSYHISPVVEFGGVAAANATLTIGLPKPTVALNAGAVSAASLGIVLPKPVLAMGASAVAGADLGIVLAEPLISMSAGTLPDNLREYVWRVLSLDPQMNALGINPDSLYSNNAPDSPAKDQRVWAILAWGLEEAPPGRDTTSRRRFLVFWVYCRENDFKKIEPVLWRARTLLYPLKAVNYAPGGWITEVTDGSLGEDLYDPAYEASTKSLNLTIIASGI